MKKYYWFDGFDGGDGSEPFDTFEEAEKAAIEQAAGIRLTRRELDNLIKKCENYIFIGYIEFPENATEEDFSEKDGEFIEINAVELNEETLDRIY